MRNESPTRVPHVTHSAFLSSHIADNQRREKAHTVILPQQYCFLFSKKRRKKKKTGVEDILAGFHKIRASLEASAHPLNGGTAVELHEIQATADIKRRGERREEGAFLTGKPHHA